MSALAASLLEKIQTRRARTGVVGLGYVGLPLAVELGKAGFHTTGIDLDDRKVYVNRTKDQIKDAPDWDPDNWRSDKYRRSVGDYYGRF